MIVPLRENGHGCVEAADVLVQQVVGVVGAELLQSLGDLGLPLGGDVLPDPAVRDRQLGRDWVIGVDRVARVNEERGLDLTHGLVDLHPAPIRVDPPALPRGVARPHETDIAPGGRRRPEAADHRLAHELMVGKVDHDDAVEHPLAAWQAGEIDPGRKVGVLESRRAADVVGIAETLRRRPLNHHARGAIGAGPDDRLVARQIARLHAVLKLRPHAFAGDHGWGVWPRERPAHDATSRDQAAAGKCRPAQQRAAAEAMRRSLDQGAAFSDSPPAGERGSAPR